MTWARRWRGQRRPREDRPRGGRPTARGGLHMDDDVLALNKPPDLAVQGDTKTARHLDAMLDALKF